MNLWLPKKLLTKSENTLKEPLSVTIIFLSEAILKIPPIGLNTDQTPKRLSLLGELVNLKCSQWADCILKLLD